MKSSKSTGNTFDRKYKKYDVWYERNNFAYVSEIDAIKKVLPKKGRGLEIGVGTGRFATALGISAGIDPSYHMVRLARNRGVNVCLAFGEAIPFLRETFDYAVVIISLCFVKNKKMVLQEAARVLKKGGKIIIGIVDKESFLGKYYRHKKSVFYKIAKFLSVVEVVDILKKTGFSSFSIYQTLFTLPERMTAAQKPKKGFGKGGFVVLSGKK